MFLPSVNVKCQMSMSNVTVETDIEAEVHSAHVYAMCQMKARGLSVHRPLSAVLHYSATSVQLLRNHNEFNTSPSPPSAYYAFCVLAPRALTAALPMGTPSGPEMPETPIASTKLSSLNMGRPPVIISQGVDSNAVRA